MAAGAWSLVVPILFGFHDDGPAFWTHVTAGVLSMLIGIGGLEIASRGGPQAMTWSQNTR